MAAPIAKIVLLDAFTSELFRGNPAAVVFSAEPLDEGTRANLAIEFNQPAIAFVSHPAILSSSTFAASRTSPLPLIRWHTSRGTGIPLCGHASMAASYYILHHFAPDLPEVRYNFPLPFLASTGQEKDVLVELVAHKTDDGRVELALPASMNYRSVAKELERAILVALAAATALSASDVEELVESPSVRIAPLHYANLNQSLFVVQSAIPYRGIYITNQWPTSEPSPSHFRSRVFFPSLGIPEDHVCGSAHTFLGPYWTTTLARAGSPLPELLEVDQVSPRGGHFGLQWNGKWGAEGGLVALRGTARLIVEGDLRL
ncbi:hypothetical protein JCM1841_005730 [Sporobolomyces salmonicolor]